MNGEALSRFLENPPLLWREDLPIQTSVLHKLTKYAKQGSLTLETGGGVTTVCFAAIGCEHTCIEPNSQICERIKDYCRENLISLDGVRFIIGKSQDYLPSLDLGGKRLDLALIDGSHTFPIPIVDYFYIDANLKVGGILVVDDLFIRSVGTLHKFLLTEPAYELITIDHTKTGIYHKIAETKYSSGWTRQRYNSPHPDLSHLRLRRRVPQKLAIVFKMENSKLTQWAHKVFQVMGWELK